MFASACTLLSSKWYLKYLLRLSREKKRTVLGVTRPRTSLWLRGCTDRCVQNIILYMYYTIPTKTPHPHPNYEACVSVKQSGTHAGSISHKKRFFSVYIIIQKIITLCNPDTNVLARMKFRTQDVVKSFV